METFGSISTFSSYEPKMLKVPKTVKTSNKKLLRQAGPNNNNKKIHHCQLLNYIQNLNHNEDNNH